MESRCFRLKSNLLKSQTLPENFRREKFETPESESNSSDLSRVLEIDTWNHGQLRKFFLGNPTQGCRDRNGCESFWVLPIRVFPVLFESEIEIRFYPSIRIDIKIRFLENLLCIKFHFRKREDFRGWTNFYRRNARFPRV